MKKTTIIKLFAIFFAIPFFLFSCVETKPEQKPDENPPVDTTDTPSTDPVLEIVAGDATSNTLTFTITAANVDKCAWICLPSDEAVPEDIYVIQKGTAIDVQSSPVTCTATALDPETEYTIAAATMSKKGYDIEVIYMTTAAAELPEVTIEATTVSFNYLTIDIATVNATNGAWTFVKAGESVPAYEDVLQSGNLLPDLTSGAASFNVNNIEAETTYTIIVAVEGIGGTSGSTLDVTSAKAPEGETKEPEIALDQSSIAVDAHSATVAYTLKYAKTAVWMVVREGDAVPTTDEILANGTSFDISAGQTSLTVDGLHAQTSYTLWVAAVGDGGTSTGSVSFTTTEDTEAFIFELNEAGWLSHINKNGEVFIKLSGDDPQRTELAIDFYCTDNTDGLVAGTYIVNSTKLANTISNARSDTYLEIYNSGGLESTVEFASGSVYVTLGENSNYTLDIDLVDAAGQHYIAVYNGKIKKQ